MINDRLNIMVDSEKISARKFSHALKLALEKVINQKYSHIQILSGTNHFEGFIGHDEVELFKKKTKLVISFFAYFSSHDISAGLIIVGR